MNNLDCPPSWLRKLKKQVRGVSWTFHASCPPGFELLTCQELEDYGIIAEIKGRGSVEWQSRIADAYSAILRLRLVSRVQVRLANFHAGAREELFRKSYEIPWELWLDKEQVVRVQAHVVHSRISHEGMCARTLTEAIVKRLADQGQKLEAPSRDKELRILIRLEDNKATISLDASGVLHYKRSYKRASVDAPLRENLAAGLVVWALEGMDYSNLRAIADPFCGSATFGLEAWSLVHGHAAGLLRSFACDSWPGLSPETRTHVRSLLSRSQKANEAVLYLSDISNAACSASRENLGIYVDFWQNYDKVSGQYKLTEADFFDLQAEPIVPGQGLVCMNPPYGIRLEANTKDLYARLLGRLESHWKHYRALCIVPHQSLEALFPKHARRIQFIHGGLHVSALAWDIV